MLSKPVNILLPNWVTGFADASQKALVIWGTNLTSTVGVKFTRTQLAMVRLAPSQYSVIIGLLLSDGWLTFASKTNKNARLGFAQSGDHAVYFWFVFLSLSHFCSSYPNVRNRTRLGKKTIGLQFETRSMPCLTKLYYLFYPAGVKIIPCPRTQFVVGFGKINSGSKNQRFFVFSARASKNSNFNFHPKTSFCTLSVLRSSTLHPWYLSGLVDAEGSFGIYLVKRSKSRLGWSVEPSFKIELHSRDIKLLKLIQAFFGIGSIINNRRNSVSFYVYSLEQISNVIIPHFEKYPLISQKQADYLLFREVIMMMVKKEHLTREGLDKIIAIRASINNGLTEKLKATFPLTKPVARPLVGNQLIPHPFWVAGFTEGDAALLYKWWDRKQIKQDIKLFSDFIYLNMYVILY